MSTTDTTVSHCVNWSAARTVSSRRRINPLPTPELFQPRASVIIIVIVVVIMAAKPSPLGQERKNTPPAGREKKPLSPLERKTPSPPGHWKKTLSPLGRDAAPLPPPAQTGHERRALPALERRAGPGHEKLALPSPGPERKAVAPSSPRRAKPSALGLERNESMVYEEEVPVIVRRRGCMLRVRITSFADDGDEGDEGEGGRPLPPIPVCTCI